MIKLEYIRSGDYFFPNLLEVDQTANERLAQLMPPMVEEVIFMELVYK